MTQFNEKSKKFILFESFSGVIETIVGIQQSTAFRAALVCTSDVKAWRTRLTLVALEQQMFTTVTVR